MRNFRNIIKIAEADEVKQRIYQFRYRIYIEEMGKPYQNADHQNKVLIDPLDEKCTLLYAEHEGAIIGTVRINWGTDAETFENFNSADFLVEKFRCFPAENLSFTSRLMICSSFRNTLLGKNLSEECFRIASAKKIAVSFISCNPKLLPFFQKLGFRIYKDEFDDANAGRQVPLVLLLEDENHLRQIRSPFYQEAQSRSNNHLIADWFQQEFSIEQPFVPAVRVS